MKKLLLITTTIFILLSCSKKDNVNPQVVIQHDTITKTVTVIQKDTVYCTPKSDIIQGTWYCYAYSNYGSSIKNTLTPSQQAIFTQTTMNWNGSASASYSYDYSLIYLNGGSTPFYKLSIYNCNEIKLIDQSSNGSSYYLRRAP
jgi:hypothetical protein